MSISFWATCCASLGLAWVTVSWKMVSCWFSILIDCASCATRAATSASLDTVLARSVPRTTFCRLIAEISVWRTRSTESIWLFGPVDMPSGRICEFWTAMRARDSYLLGIWATNSHPNMHTAHATASASQRRIHIAWRAIRISS